MNSSLSEIETRLIDRSLDEDLSNEEHEELQVLLKAKPEAREAYYEQSSLAAMLTFEAKAAAEVPEIAPVLRPKLTSTIILIGALAAALVCAFLIGRNNAEPPAFAQSARPLESVPLDAVTTPLPSNRELRPTQANLPQSLESGVLRMDFPGVRLAIAGPAEFTKLSKNRLRLTSGTILAHVAPKAVGFVVETPSATVTDLGTVFGIRVTRDSRVVTHVFEGSVVVAPTNSTVATLSRNQSLSVWSDGSAPLPPGASDLNEFRSLVPYAPDVLAGISGGQLPQLTIPDPVYGTQVGRWHPGELTKEPQLLSWDVSNLVHSGNDDVHTVSFPRQFESRAEIHSVELVQEGRVVASASNQSRLRPGKVQHGVAYRLHVPASLGSKAPTTLRISISSRAPRSDSGMIWFKLSTAPATLQKDARNWNRNLALGKKATSASHEGNKHPDLAVDGESSTDHGWWASPLPQHLIVDLEKVESVNRVHAHLYAKQLRYYQYQIEVSTDAQAWRRVVDMSRNSLLAVPVGDPHEFPPTDARYVRFRFLLNSANDAGHLAELRVFPTPK